MGLTNNLGKLSNMITSTGSAVGIGTSSPNTYTIAPQLVVDSGASGGGLTIKTGTTSSTTNYGGVFFADGTTGSEQYRGFIQYNHNFNSLTDTLILGTAGTEKMYITSGGNVGIGTSSPSYQLDIQNGSSPSLRVRNNAAGGTATLLLETANTFSGTSQAYVQCIGTAGGGQSQLVFATAGASGDSTATERLRITSTGNVGIGTSNPTNSLSGDETTLQISNSNVACISLQSTGSGGHKYALGSLGSAGAFGIYDVTAAAYRFQITSSGAVLTPSRPAFRAYYSSNGIWTIVGGGVFNFDSTEYNIGGGFNTSNGSFVAPVAGVYQFNFYTIVLGNYLNAAIAFKKNGSPLASGTNVHFSPYYPANPWNNVVYTTSLYLSAGDYVQMFNIGGTTDFHGRDWSSFSGYLVG